MTDEEEPSFGDKVHHTNHDDSAGLCGRRGFLVESWRHVTCPDCLAWRPEPDTERSPERHLALLPREDE
jgi:hypothetical protein